MKIFQKIAHILLVTFLLFETSSCTEPYALQSNNYQNYLVVEATITNGIKHQEVKLTRTYRLEENEPTIEENAVIKIIGSNGSIFLFTQQGESYFSNNEFEPLPNVDYRLDFTYHFKLRINCSGSKNQRIRNKWSRNSS